MMERIGIYYAVTANLSILASTLITAYCYFYLVKGFMRRKKYAWLVGAAYFVIIMVLYNIPFVMDNVTVYGLGSLLGLLVMYLLDRENLTQKIFLAVTFFSLRWLSMAMEGCIYKLIYRYSFFFPGFAESQKLQFVIYAVSICVSAVLRFAFLFTSVWMIQRAYVYKKEKMTGKEFVMLVIPSLSGVIGYGMLQYYSAVYEKETGKSLFDIYGIYNWFCFLYYGISFAAILVMIVVFQNLKGRQEEEKQNELLTSQIEDMKNHISEVERLYRDIRSLRHDMGNHVMTLENLCLKNEHEEARHYVTQLKEQLNEMTLEVKSGNPVTDVILTEKRKEAEEKGIRFVCEFHYPEGTKINAFDVSVILNNALNNAIEGISGGEKPFIYISSYRTGNAFLLEVKNSFRGRIELDKESGLPVTSKKDGSRHGLGLANIQRVAQKYYGDIAIEQEEDCFMLSVMLMTA